MEQLKVLDYSNVFIASYFTDDRECAHPNAEHTLIYLVSGELEISDNGKITDVCYKVGFKNLSHFSKVFKEKYGMAPTALV